MKKRDLVALLADVGDDEEICHVYYNDEDNMSRFSGDFHKSVYFRRGSTERVVVINLEPHDVVDNNSYISEKEQKQKEETERMLNSFPSKEKPLWSIRDSYGCSIHVLFKFQAFEYHYAIMKYSGTYHIMHLEGDMNHVPFTTWDDFFQRTKPLITKSLQKYREGIECFDVNSI